MWSVWLFSVIVIFILSALWWIRIIGLWKLPDGRHWLRGKLGLVWMGRTMLSKSLIHFSVDWQGCIPSLLFDLRLNYIGDNEDNGDLLQRVPSMHCCTQWPQPCSRPPPTHAPTGDSWTLTGKSGQSLRGHCSFLLGPGMQKLLFVPSKSLFPQACVSSGGSMVGLTATSSKRAYAIPGATFIY